MKSALTYVLPTAVISLLAGVAIARATTEPAPAQLTETELRRELSALASQLKAAPGAGVALSAAAAPKAAAQAVSSVSEPDPSLVPKADPARAGDPEAFQKGKEFVEQALLRGSWDGDQARALRAVASDLSPDQRAQLMQRIAVVNAGRLKPSGRPGAWFF